MYDVNSFPHIHFFLRCVTKPLVRWQIIVPNRHAVEYGQGKLGLLKGSDLRSIISTIIAGQGVFIFGDMSCACICGLLFPTHLPRIRTWLRLSFWDPPSGAPEALVLNRSQRSKDAATSWKQDQVFQQRNERAELQFQRLKVERVEGTHLACWGLRRNAARDRNLCLTV